MKLRCTIGSQGFVGGDTYHYGDVYEVNTKEMGGMLIKQGYAEDVEEIVSIAPPAPIPPLLKANKESTPERDRAGKARRK